MYPGRAYVKNNPQQMEGGIEGTNTACLEIWLGW